MANQLVQQLLALRTQLEASIIGQPTAVDTVMGAIERYQAGMHDGKGPIGTFLLIGPTGSGKTYTVEKLAEFLYDTPDSLIRLDCSEYSLDQDVAKIFGAAPGYIGSDVPGPLTKLYNAVPNKDQGFILLLDEIEKAGAKFFDTWLQVFSAGHLTDGKGNKLDFTKALIFLTSNVGAENYAESSDIGFRTITARQTVQRVEAQVHAALKRKFKPEFLNRLTGTINFAPLTSEQQGQILEIHLKALNDRLRGHDIRLAPTAKLKQHLLEVGFSKEYGARELKRALIAKLESPLAKKIIYGEVPKDSLVVVDLNDAKELEVRRIGDYPILMEEALAS